MEGAGVCQQLLAYRLEDTCNIGKEEGPAFSDASVCFKKAG